jgi:hypothetical protein
MLVPLEPIDALGSTPSRPPNETAMMVRSPDKSRVQLEGMPSRDGNHRGRRITDVTIPMSDRNPT